MIQIEPYDLTGQAVPRSVFPWRLEPDRSALLVHDMQRYFIRPFELSPLRQALVDGVARVIEVARAQAMPVFYTAQPGGMTPRERGLMYPLWGPGMSRREEDRGICPEVAPMPDDVVLTKWRYSAFHRSDLENRLRDHGRDQLLVCGVYAQVGIQATVVDAFSRDIEPFVVTDAVADFSARSHADALEYVARNCAVVTTVASLAAVGSAA